MKKIDISKPFYVVLKPVFYTLYAGAMAHIAYTEVKKVVKEIKK